MRAKNVSYFLLCESDFGTSKWQSGQCSAIGNLDQLGLKQLDTVTIFSFHRLGIGQAQDLPLLGLFPVGETTLVVVLDVEVRNSYQYLNPDCDIITVQRTLKEEEGHLNEYEDMIDAKQRIEHFITQIYNHKCPYSALGYLSPLILINNTCLNFGDLWTKLTLAVQPT